MRIYRWCLDIIMLVLLILVMGYHIFKDTVHAYLGILLLLCVMFHLYGHRRWYAGLTKGTYGKKRILLTFINMALLLAVVLTAVSSIMLSTSVFSFLIAHPSAFGRRIHLCSTTWFFVLAAMHTGLHYRSILKKGTISRFMKLAMILFCCILFFYGTHQFLQRGMWKDLLLVEEYKYLAYGESPVRWLLDTVSIWLAAGMATAAAGKQLQGR